MDWMKEFTANERLVTLAEIAEFAQVEEPTVVEAAEAGDLQGLRLGTEWRFTAEHVLAWMKNDPIEDSGNDFFAEKTAFSRMTHPYDQVQPMTAEFYAAAMDLGAEPVRFELGAEEMDVVTVRLEETRSGRTDWMEVHATKDGRLFTWLPYASGLGSYAFSSDLSLLDEGDLDAFVVEVWLSMNAQLRRFALGEANAMHTDLNEYEGRLCIEPSDSPRELIMVTAAEVVAERLEERLKSGTVDRVDRYAIHQEVLAHLKRKDKEDCVSAAIAQLGEAVLFPAKEDAAGFDSWFYSDYHLKSKVAFFIAWRADWLLRRAGHPMLSSSWLLPQNTEAA